MKKPNLTIAPLKGRTWDKYAGEPDSPNFMPPSPLIERRRLSMRQEAELKRACGLMLVNVKSSDGLLDDVAYLKDAIEVGKKRTKHDKHSSFTFNKGPKLVGVEPAPEKKPNKGTRQYFDVEATFEPLEPMLTRTSRKQKPSSFGDPEQEALYEIRSKLEVRPKTSAAACIDYAGGETSSSSNRTTYTTPFTSAGITPGSTSKRFSGFVGEPVDTVEPVPHLSNSDPLNMDPEVVAQARSWLASEFARRRQKDESNTHDDSSAKPVRAFHPAPSQPSPAPYQPNPVIRRPISRAGSIKNSIREYIRPGSSRAESIRSSAVSTTSTSTSSQIRSGFAAIRQKFSRRGSSTSSRPGRDDGDEYFINASQVQFEMLNKTLPPLPGLDSYVEPRPRHLAQLFARPGRRDDTGDRIISDDGMERVLSNEEVVKRKEDMSRAVLEKMTTGSIGSGDMDSAGRRSMQTQRNSGNTSSSNSGAASIGLSRSATTGRVTHKKSQDRLKTIRKVADEKFSQYGHGSNDQKMSRYPQSGGKVGDVTIVRSVDMNQSSANSQGKRNNDGGMKSPFLKRFFGLGKNSKIDGAIAA